jgi:DNA processing protein
MATKGAAAPFVFYLSGAASARRGLAPFIGDPPDPATAHPALKLDPTTRADAISWLRLTLVPGVSPKAQRSLLAAFSNPSQILQASRNAIASIVGPATAEALARGPDAALVDATLGWLDHDSRHLVTFGGVGYPRQLLEIDDPPAVLYARGRVELLDSPSVAIVGSRNATSLGARDAQAFATELSNAGFCIVSGLAAGIDAAAHRGGLAGAGSSVAIMGTGPEQIYPDSNRKLAEELAMRGCLVSEFPLGTSPLPANFPRRNRLISGLSHGVLVVEAALRSGSLITARTALDQGREVFAIPGSIHSALSKGCHDLIRQGAKLVESADDILDEFTWQAPRAPRAEPVEGIEDDPVLAAMGYAPLSMDQIAQLTGMRASSLAVGLSRLEIQGRVAALAGGLFQRIVNPVIE